MNDMTSVTQSGQADQDDCPMPDLELRAYAYAFQEWLESAETFEAFKLYVTKELQRLGFSDWSYTRLDIPPAAREAVGTFGDEYYAHSLGYDLMHEHVALTTSQLPVFRSTIKEFLQQSPIEVDTLIQGGELYQHYDRLGYNECIGIPLSFADEDNHALFTLAASGEDSDHIKETFLSCEDKVKIIAQTVEDTGNDCYPDYFIGVKQKFDCLAKSRQLKLLVAMIEHDCGIPEAAKMNDITRAAADKQLARIRKWLNVDTTHAAVLKAIKLGLIGCDALAD